MKKLIPLIAMSLISYSAYAADLPIQTVNNPSSPPKANWAGAYVGLNAGGVWSNNSSSAISTFPLYASNAFSPNSILAASTAANSFSSGGYSGFIGGGQIGYNLAFDPGTSGLVVGFEADIQGVAGSSFSPSKPSIAPIASTSASWISSANMSTSLDYLGTARGRLGIQITPNVLIYGTGGLAYGGLSGRTNMSWIGTPQGSFSSGGGVFYGSGSTSNTAVGWTAGGGAEWMFASNWSAKVEYLYYNLGKLSYSSTAARLTNIGVASIYASQTNTSIDGNLVRLGINYHFHTPSLAEIAKYQ